MKLGVTALFLLSVGHAQLPAIGSFANNLLGALVESHYRGVFDSWDWRQSTDR